MEVERASSEILYTSSVSTNSLITAGSTLGGVGGRGHNDAQVAPFARSRRSLAEPTTASGHLQSKKLWQPKPVVVNTNSLPLSTATGNNIRKTASSPTSEPPPPMIAPVSGVPNIKGKQVIRPIAFRPVPGGGSGASTPTNSHFGSFRPVGAPSSGHTTPSQPTYIDQPSPAPPPAGGGLQLIGSTTVTHPTNPALPKANEGFAPGHPLVKDGRRHYGSSQELHGSQPHHPPAFSKFNSLDRRALARRHHSRIAVGVPDQPDISTSSNSGQIKINCPQSLPNSSSVPGGSSVLLRTSMNGKLEGSSGGGVVAAAGTDPAGKSSEVVRTAGINISGLPELPFRPGSSTSVNGGAGVSVSGAKKPGTAATAALYSSQESLQSVQMKSYPRSNAGTPQFQNLSGSVVSCVTGGRQGSGRRSSGGGGVTNDRSSATSITFGAGNKLCNNSSSSTNIYANMAEIRQNDATRHSTSVSTTGPFVNGVKSSELVTASPYIMTSSVTDTSGGTPSSGTPPEIGVNNNGGASSRNTSGCFSTGSGSSGSSAGGSASRGGVNGNPVPASPDSAVGCVDSTEAMLKEKDNEISYLRSTIEQNEQAYEEKEKLWEKELRKIKGLYDNRLRASQQKSSKMEQALTNQTYQLQSDKRRLERDLEDIRKMHDSKNTENSNLQKELIGLRGKMSVGGDGDDSISLSYKDLSQTSHDPPPTTAAPHSNSDQAMRIELERSQSQIKDLEMSRSSLRSEVDRLKSLLEVAADCCPQSSTESTTEYDTATERDISESSTSSKEGQTGGGLESLPKSQLVAKIQKLNRAMLSNYKKGHRTHTSRMSSSSDDEEEDSVAKETQKEIIIARDLTIEKLTKEGEALNTSLSSLSRQHEELKALFESERSHWLDEKEKVIRYQKQLQLNYVQMYKRNKVLESEMEALNKSLADAEARAQQFQTQMEEAALVRSSTVSGGSAGGAASSGGSGKSSKVGGRSSHKASKSHSFLSRDSHSGSSTSLSKAVKSGSSSAAAAAQNMIQKTGNSVRARLMKMSLHTDSSQC